MIYEFQRFYRTEWNTPRLAGDPPHFANAQGTVNYGNVHTLDELGEWVIDRSADGDAEGWEYAHTFEDLRDTAEEEEEEAAERERELRALRGEEVGAEAGGDFVMVEAGEEPDDPAAEDVPLSALSAKRLRRSTMAQRGEAAAAAANMLPLALRGGSSSSVLRSVTGAAPAESLARRRRWVRRGTDAEARCAELAAARREAGASDGEEEEEASHAGSAVSGVRARASSFASAGKGAVLQRIVANMCDPERGLADSRKGGAGPGEPALVFTYGALLQWMQSLRSLRSTGSAGLQHVATQLVAEGLVTKYSAGRGGKSGNPFVKLDQGASHVGGSASSLASGDGEDGHAGVRPYVGSWRPSRSTVLCVPEEVAERVTRPDGPRSLASRSVASAMRALGDAGKSLSRGRHKAPEAVAEAAHEEEEEEEEGSGGTAVGADADTSSRASAEAVVDPVDEARQTKRVWSGAWIRTAAPDPRAANGTASTADAHCARVCLSMAGGQLEVYPHGTLRLTGDQPRMDPMLRLPPDALLAVRSVWDEDLACAGSPGEAEAAGEGTEAKEAKIDGEDDEDEEKKGEVPPANGSKGASAGSNSAPASGGGSRGTTPAPGRCGGEWDPRAEAASAPPPDTSQQRKASLRLWRLGQSPWRWLEITFDPSARSGEARCAWQRGKRYCPCTRWSPYSHTHTHALPPRALCMQRRACAAPGAPLRRRRATRGRWKRCGLRPVTCRG